MSAEFFNRILTKKNSLLSCSGNFKLFFYFSLEAAPLEDQQQATLAVELQLSIYADFFQ